ncbi:cytochrome P450 46A1 [Didymella exigua CBS 183.55]|uniref:Cytochrome P450 46A1 n=1 Tax=Didymella exigua CBS 183.55 TaxID=1150837 RepID=A0A6A5S3D7_9PLEO|nr:cytochrome P450 46A1 [Didymella exigua CBS 183.55]KAF1933944.1 cytochrome P450 46A1 [Didymella exigua CBS 183.55]
MSLVNLRQAYTLKKRFLVKNNLPCQVSYVEKLTAKSGLQSLTNQTWKGAGLLRKLLVAWVARGLHQLYLHPLRNVPGPALSAFTILPHFIAVSRGYLNRYLRHLHGRYGQVVRIAPDELSFVDPDALCDIYGYGIKGNQGRPSDAEYARVRRISSPAFSERALTEQEPVFVKYADQLVRVLQKISYDEPKSAIDVVKMFNFTTFDVMADMTFGEPLHMLDNTEYMPWVSMIFGYIKVATCVGILRAYCPHIFGLIQLVFSGTIHKARTAHMQHTVTRVTKRLEQGRKTEGIDLSTYVLDQQGKGKEGLSRGSMDANASLFMVAGTETTATTLSGLTYMLIRNPSTMRKLTAEIRESFASSPDISMESLTQLPYLNACIKEAMRIYPSVPVGFPHLTPTEGSTRWTGDQEFADKRAAVQPFSVGSRDCLGKNMATHEMRLILTKVVWSFDLQLCEQQSDWLEQKLYSTWEKMPLMVKLKMAQR